MRKEINSNETVGVYREDRDKYTGIGNITVADAPPVLIQPGASVLDDLGLQEIREEMDAEHNRMIRTKYDLAVYRVTPALIVPAGEEKSPFDSIYERETEPQPVPASADEVQRAIDAQSICDPQYRKTAKKFLCEVIPKVDAEADRLISEVVRAENELAHMQREYSKKVEAARAELKAFNEGVYNEYRKFETANAGSTIESGHTVTTSKCRRLVNNYSEDMMHRYKMLQAVKDVIDSYEAGRRSVNPEQVKEVARNSVPQPVRRSVTDVIREFFKGQ